jgi:autotransporter family porin
MDKLSRASRRVIAKCRLKETSLNTKNKFSSASLCSITTLAVAVSMALASTSVYAVECSLTGGTTTQKPCVASGTDESATLSITGTNTLSHTTTPIYVYSNGIGEAKLTSNGNLSIANSGSTHGINIRGLSDSGKAIAEFSGSTNITLSATGDTALLVSSGSDSSVKISGDFNITNNSTAGTVNERDGIEVNTWGVNGGDVTLTHTGQGLISVKNGNAIHTNAKGSSGNIVIDLSGTGKGIQLSTDGDNHKGISSILHTGNLNGSIDIKSNATISTNGSSAYGIFANAAGNTVSAAATGGLININNTGTINSNAAGSAGYLAHGIATLNKDHDTIIHNDGTIITQGDDASGIRAEQTVDSVTGDITVTTGSNSYIETNYANADGIHVNIGSEQTGSAINNNSHIMVVAEGSIKTTGNGSAEGIYGAIRNGSNTGDITLVFKGDTIETTGTGTNRGIYGRQDGQGNMTLAHYGQQIITQGNGAYGLYALVGNGGTTINSGDIKIFSTGQISTGGYGAHGIYANILNNANSLLIENSGSIATGGSASSGIRVSSAGSSGIIINNILHSSDAITTNGDSSHGIHAYIENLGTDSGGITVNQQGGTITTSGPGLLGGESNSHGINLLTDAKTGDLNINLIDTLIDVKGRNSDGINVQNQNAADSDLNINIYTSGGEIKVLDPTVAQSGDSNFGIVAIQYGQAAGDISVKNNGTKISIGTGADGTADRSAAISATFTDNGATGNIIIASSGELSTQGDGYASSAIYANNKGSGNTDILNAGAINLTGNSVSGIYAINASGQINVMNTGDITSISNDQSRAIYVDSDRGSITIQNEGRLTVGDSLASGGDGAQGITAIVNKGTEHAVILNKGDITTGGSNKSVGIYAGNAGAGNAVIVSDGANITTNGLGLNNHGIHAYTSSGLAAITFSNGTVNVQGQSAGLIATNNASGQAEITLSNATVNGGKTFGQAAVVATSPNAASVAIGANSHIMGGWSNGSLIGKGLQLDGETGFLTNFGSLGAMSDFAIVTQSGTSTTATHTIDNYGTITGYVTFGDEDTTFSNWSSNSWNIRHFADTDGDGIRDAKEIAVSDFGAGYDVFKNEATGTVRLLAVSGETNIPVAAGYIPDGALDITNAGTVHGHLLNLDRFENRGTIDLSDNGQAGDVLLITGGATAGANGGGKFVADGGFLRLDTVLNDGDLNSLSDVLVVDEIEAGSGVTRITINRVGGMGAITIGDGIKVVDVLGTADAGSFALDGVVKGGIYEYTLHEGSVTTPGNNSLFLRTNAQQLNPDIGSYLANQTAATGLFMHNLHDRLGEPQLYQNYREEDKSIPAVWLRAVAGHTKNEAGGGLLNQHSESTLLHLGGEVADWSSNGDDRFHLGLMGAWGRTETKTTSQTTGSLVKSSIDGYGIGAYLTWYDNPANVEGWYSDVWTMYNWFNNETEGSAKYDSESWTTSLEVGYAMKLSALENYDWMLEPQGQVAYNYYSVDSIKDRNGMKVTDSDANGFATRLGMRTYLRPSTFRNGAQPFFEVNWLYNSANNSMMFNGERIADDTPENRFEAKVGVQGEMTKHLQVYSHIGLQWGQNSYEHAEGQVGVRYRF